MKRTLYFGNPAYLSTKMEQIIINLGDDNERVVPIEDIAVVILDHPQITITQPVISKLLEYNVALVSCNKTHHPTGLMLNLDGHTRQSKHFKSQIEAHQPLKKQLWKQTIKAKLYNQSQLLQIISQPTSYIDRLKKQVASGDSTNTEAQGAQYYWKHYFHHFDLKSFNRERYGDSPNNLLNYGYAILRAIVARSLVGSGLLPTLGIFHRNQYNAYCLADDIMEPYRPFVDLLVIDIVEQHGLVEDLDRDVKQQLLQIPTLDVMINKKKRPLMVAVQQTTASLAKSFDSKENKVVYPVLV